MKKGRSIISFIIIICLGISSLIMSKGVLEEVVHREVGLWLQGQPELFTSQLTNEQQGELISTLQNFSNDHDFILISQDQTIQQSGARIYTFSVFASSNIDAVSLDPLVILGTPIVNKELVQEVAGAEIDGYAGYGNDAFKRIKDLPSIRSGADFRVDRIESGEGLGSSCKVLGLSQAEFQELLDNVSSSTGVSGEALATQMSGSTSVLGLLYVFSGGAFVLLSIVFCLLMVTHALLELKTLGIYLMLGWSKSDFVSKLFSAQIPQLLVIIPLGALGTYAVLDGFALNTSVLGYACATMLPTVFVVLASLGIAAISFASIKPVDAISSRYSRRGFYALTVAVYLMCLAAVFGGCLYIDQPLEIYTNLLHTQSSWSEYADWYVLQDFMMGDARFTGNPLGASEDMYSWYAAHEHDEGVFLAHVTYLGDVTIQAYLPEGPRPEPFWYLAASPSYLKQIGIEVSEDDIARAENGTRVYLLPKALDSSQTETLEHFLRASSQPFDSNIVTPFMKDQTYEFSSYDDTQQLFTWSTDAEQPTTTNHFIIAIITTNNMIPFESESLIAGGPENDYIKLSPMGASEILDNTGTFALNGSSLRARFATVENYIGGIQKNLEELFALFSVVMLVMVATIAVMIVCLINVVNRMSAREIGVKYVLGFGAWDLYKGEILFVNLSILAGILVCAVLGSNAGMIVGTALLGISNFVIFDMVRRRSVSVVLENVSKEQ